MKLRNNIYYDDYNINQDNFIRETCATEWVLPSRHDLVKDIPYLPTVIKNSSFR